MIRNTPECKPAGPGRPKDLAKRAAILDAAKRLFVLQGFAGVSMDQIAAEAGVSKLTVYSHFGDKDGLFAEAVRAHCELGMPTRLFEPDPAVPLRERLTDIGEAFFAMIMTPEAIAGHRILCSPQVTGSQMPATFWEAGPQRVQNGFTALLERRIAAGELEIDDPVRAAGQFFTLLKGELHARAVFGYCCSARHDTAQEHVASVVELFLRAYAKR
ncbi:TetR/AcrR family transcriptional regulator [Thermomonas fusca]|uniref:TetR/AcrR family transcriptional regulator n=1 Tax=Thermomonas fusca TaxID=215690 RepID=A0A5R9PK96_9GAMM|nr:TetR/AcrR family transcriptional regulator [Thermomonas fusca]TLX23020.1 TetR/AcrR family transcriptional regulator [Thermomonas fusca]